jgi:hypothetical protein
MLRGPKPALPHLIPSAPLQLRLSKPQAKVLLQLLRSPCVSKGIA